MFDSFQCESTLEVAGKKIYYFDLIAAENNGLTGISNLPFSLKILLENLLRHEDNKVVQKIDLEAFVQWLSSKSSRHEISYHPSRVLLQDFTGVPAVVDLAAMRDAMIDLEGDPSKINPLCPVDLVIDHSVVVDEYGTKDAFNNNVEYEMQRNLERYKAIKWAQEHLDNFRVVPPGTGICHQVNLEYLGKCVGQKDIQGNNYAFFDTLVGTDSHTTMINGLGVLGWGVGGIEAEAAMLGQGISMRIPEVIGVRITGELTQGVTATDLVLTITELLRKKGVVGKFVEFFGPGLKNLSLADRATISNMAPEYGATCAIFPVDQVALSYLQLTGRNKQNTELVEAYCKAQGTWYDEHSSDPVCTDTVTLDLKEIAPSIAGPKRPQDRILLSQLKAETTKIIAQQEKQVPTKDKAKDIQHGAVVIAAITSCTNTSNPSVMMAAGLIAKKAVEKGLQVKPWVKTSLAPGSKVVTEYLQAAGLIPYLEQLGFYLVGYGCTSCIGNSGPLNESIQQEVVDKDLLVSAVLSGNRNFEGRIHPLVKANWLASPPLVVAYALAGTTYIDIDLDPIALDNNNQEVFLKDIWPSNDEIQEAVNMVHDRMFKTQYADVFSGDKLWQSISSATQSTYAWDASSTYIQKPNFFDNIKQGKKEQSEIKDARILALLGDSVTTDHISPAGNIKVNSPSGQYLLQHEVEVKDFNSYGSRRGNHEVMIRGTFANIRLQNEMVPGTTGGYTTHYPSNKQMTIYDAAVSYNKEHVPLVVIAGKEYGTGSSRDWAAKGTTLLGVKAVVAESFERIHRSNLIGMGVLPLQFMTGVNRHSLELTGKEQIDIHLPAYHDLSPSMEVNASIKSNGESTARLTLLCRIDTQKEMSYFQAGGILQYVLQELKR